MADKFGFVGAENEVIQEIFGLTSDGCFCFTLPRTWNKHIVKLKESVVNE